MASENESERRETLADIVADFRQYVANTKIHPEVAETINCYLDRIAAAAKRDKAEAEANALACGGIVEASRHTPGNAAALREALERLRAEIGLFYNNEWIPYDAWQGCDDMISHALSAPPHKGKWENGTMYEYEYAYCSECGRMQWAGWDTHKQADEEIGSFARDYKFCPGCGAEMEGGVYVY